MLNKPGKFDRILQAERDYRSASTHEQVHPVPLDQLKQKPEYQPRKYLDPVAMTELVNSIREHGIQEPLIVHRESDAMYIVQGHRRYAAAQQLGHLAVPCLVRDVTDPELFALLLNLARKDIDPVSEAEWYADLIEKRRWHQDEIARRMGKDRTNITHTLAITKLSQPERDALRTCGAPKSLCIQIAHTKDTHTRRRMIARARESVGLTVRKAKHMRRPQVPNPGHTITLRHDPYQVMIRSQKTRITVRELAHLCDQLASALRNGSLRPEPRA